MTMDGLGTRQEPADPLDCALDLMRRLPPNNVVENLHRLVTLCPETAEDLLASVDQPLRALVCPVSGKEYLVCDYNRDENSYRSPYSNEYDPPLPNGVRPSPGLRKLEEQANVAFGVYRDQYFEEGGLSSVYFWDTGPNTFASVVLLKKTVEGALDAASSSGVWDSIHVFEVTEGPARTASYKLTSTIVLHMKSPCMPATSGSSNVGSHTSSGSSSEQSQFSSVQQGKGTLGLCGSISRQTDAVHKLENKASHIANIGGMVEDMEIRLREVLRSVYFQRTNELIGRLRHPHDQNQNSNALKMQSELIGRLGGRKIL